LTDIAGAAYRGVRERVSALVRTLDPAAATPVPATPAWSVPDLLARLVGVSRDAVEGRLDGVSTDAWTAAQVDRRRDASTARRPAVRPAGRLARRALRRGPTTP
jgi:hypothetical protein